MTDRTQQNTHPDPNDESKRLAKQSITDLGDEQAAASVPGASGYDDPGQRHEVVDTVFDDPRIKGAEHVTVAVPRGDTVALDEVRNRLEDEHTRPAGASILVEGRPATGAARATDEDSDVPQLPHADGRPHPDGAAGEASTAPHRPARANQSATDLNRAAEAADAISTDRDLRANTRDLRADTRDQRADRRDGIIGNRDANAESDRSAARRDRQAAAGDRAHAKDDREAAAADRRTSAARASNLGFDDLTGSYVRGPGKREPDREVPRAKRTGDSRPSWSSSTSTASKTRTTRSATKPKTGS